MERRSRLERKTELKRGEGPKANPDTTQRWQRKSRRKLPAKSAQRIEETPERQALVAQVKREQPQCYARIPTICTLWTEEVNEIVRRSQWKAGYLIRWNTEGLCHNCHAFITAHPGGDGWAARHGHQIEGKVRDLGNSAFVMAVQVAQAVRRRTSGRCDASCTTDHRVEEEKRRARF